MPSGEQDVVGTQHVRKAALGSEVGILTTRNPSRPPREARRRSSPRVKDPQPEIEVRARGMVLREKVPMLL